MPLIPPPSRDKILVYLAITVAYSECLLILYIAVLKKVRYTLCPMPYALCPMPYAHEYLIFLRKAIAVLKRGEVWGRVLCLCPRRPMPTEAYAHGGLCPMPATAPNVTEIGYNLTSASLRIHARLNLNSPISNLNLIGGLRSYSEKCILQFLRNCRRRLASLPRL